MATLFIAVEGFEWGCEDSTKQSVDLSFLQQDVDYSLTTSTHTKCLTKPAILAISVNAVSFAQLKTGVIDGSTVVCTGLTGEIQGSSEKVQESFVLADSIDTVTGYTGAASMGSLTAVWTNTETGATGQETLTVWANSAGQDKVRAI